MSVRRQALESLIGCFADDPKDRFVAVRPPRPTNMSEWVRSRGLFYLAAAFPDHGDTLPFVLDRADNDPSEHVRCQGIESIAALAPPNVGTFLRDRLKNDPSELVRATSLERLVEAALAGLGDTGGRFNRML